MSLKEMKWASENEFGRLSQALGSGLEFCFASEDNNQVGPFAYCKDYMQDAIAGCVNKQRSSIYGFTYEPTQKHHPCLDKAKILIGNSSDAKLRDKIPNVVDLINQIEDSLKIPHTTITECANPPKKYIQGGVWLVEGDKRWIASPVMVSFYTLMLRIGPVHKIGTPFMETLKGINTRKIAPYQSADSGRLIGAITGIEYILKYGDTKVFHESLEKNYPSTISVSTMHNYMGIMAFARGSSKEYIPYWHRKIEDDVIVVESKKESKPKAKAKAKPKAKSSVVKKVKSLVKLV